MRRETQSVDFGGTHHKFASEKLHKFLLGSYLLCHALCLYHYLLIIVPVIIAMQRSEVLSFSRPFFLFRVTR
jgi:hypothetical protein